MNKLKPQDYHKFNEIGCQIGVKRHASRHQTSLDSLAELICVRKLFNGGNINISQLYSP
jgi:hypothetical protein